MKILYLFLILTCSTYSIDAFSWDSKINKRWGPTIDKAWGTRIDTTWNSRINRHKPKIECKKKSGSIDLRYYGGNFAVSMDDLAETFTWWATYANLEKDICELKLGEGWSLPSKDELKKIYFARHIVKNLSDAFYWSSDSKGFKAYTVDTIQGRAGYLPKSHEFKIRCIWRY